MTDDHNIIYGKIHRLEDTSQLPHGPLAQVVPSSNQGQLTPFFSPTTNWEQHNYVNTHHKNQKMWLENLNAEEACENLIILIINKVYLEA